jgi:hypothetical protein
MVYFRSICNLITYSIFLVVFSSVSQADEEVLIQKICNVFATDIAGTYDEYDDPNRVEVYTYDDVNEYCKESIEPNLIESSDSPYYQFEAFVCGYVYQSESIAYSPEDESLEFLGGSGSGGDCPY